jgi:pyrroloquinoline quinone biosynthesis protein B
VRSQSCVAVSADGHAWFLINASPDLRQQIEAFPGLHPSPESKRNTPIEAVLLTNADLDHVLGLYLLREAGRLRVIAPGSIFETLARDLRLTEVLAPYCKIEHYEPPTGTSAPLPMRDAKSPTLRFRAIPLSAKPPPYSQGESREGVQSVAYEIVDEETKGQLVVAPDVAAITPELQAAMETADAVLFDGTFWSNHEFEEITGRKRSAEDMGHLTIRDGSLALLSKVKARHKIYFHINNTNPILRADSAERVEVEGAGVSVGQDGMELEL